MAFDISINRFPGFAQLTVFGEAQIKDFVELVGAIEAETIYWSDRRVLVDLRGVTGELTSPEQVFLGELTAQSMRHLDRVASVVPPGQLTRNSENAAQGLGVQLRVFASPDDAIAWLSADALTHAG